MSVPGESQQYRLSVSRPLLTGTIRGWVGGLQSHTAFAAETFGRCSISSDRHDDGPRTTVQQMEYGIRRAEEFVPVPHPDVPGLSTASLVDRSHGAVHCEAALATLLPGGVIPGHRHPFEESFYIFSGTGVLNIDGYEYAVGPNDYGFVPIAAPHTWRATGPEPLHWFRVRGPQPRPLGERHGTYPVDMTTPGMGTPVAELDVSRKLVGHFNEDNLPPPGPLSMRGFRGPEVVNIQLWMLVDDLIGALHQTLFVVQFHPMDGKQTASTHFHPFEEAYYFLSGRATAYIEDEVTEVGPGDLVFTGTGALHGYTPLGDEPIRWLEIQSPPPPPSGAVFFPHEWSEL